MSTDKKIEPSKQQPKADLAKADKPLTPSELDIVTGGITIHHEGL